MSKFFEKIHRVIIKRKMFRQGTFRISELVKNVYGTDARLSNVYVNNFSMIIEWEYESDDIPRSKHRMSLERLQDRYFNMIEYSQGRMSREEYEEKEFGDLMVP